MPATAPARKRSSPEPRSTTKANWREFAAAAPELASFGEQRLRDTLLVMLGTIRADGRPRISACEAYIVDGDLMLGMMWQSKKALDLLRDPRLTVVTPQADHESPFGDLKLYGRAVDVREPARRKALEEAQQAAINWHPTEPYHLFSVDIESAGFVSFGKDRKLLVWSVDKGVRVLRHPDAKEDD